MSAVVLNPEIVVGKREDGTEVVCVDIMSLLSEVEREERLSGMHEAAILELYFVLKRVLYETMAEQAMKKQQEGKKADEPARHTTADVARSGTEVDEQGVKSGAQDKQAQRKYQFEKPAPLP
jgi:hypothetical protein